MIMIYNRNIEMHYLEDIREKLTPEQTGEIESKKDEFDYVIFHVGENGEVELEFVHDDLHDASDRVMNDQSFYLTMEEAVDYVNGVFPAVLTEDYDVTAE